MKPPDASLSPSTPRSRAWPIFLAGAAIGVGGLLALQALVLNSKTDDAVTEEVITFATAEVAIADLIEEVEWAGSLHYGQQIAVTGDGGTVTAIVPEGTQLQRGDPVVEVDAVPRVIFYGNVPSFRDMAESTEGPDVLQLETNLVALGYDPDSTVTVDETFTAYTALMVQRWQEDMGVDTTGVVGSNDIVVVEGPVVLLDGPEVGAMAAGALAVLVPQGELTVTVPVDVTEADEWSVGEEVVVVLADGTEREAVVDSVGTEITSDQAGTTVDITLSLQDAADGLQEGPVTVRTVGEAVRGAIVVPTRALVALAEGGFGVEVKTPNESPRLTGVEIGAFDDGLVEVTAGELAPGDLVMVPR